MQEASQILIFFQNILILYVVLMLVYLFPLPTPCFIYCTCQKHNCLVPRLQTWERERELTGVNWSLVLTQGTHKLCHHPPCMGELGTAELWVQETTAKHGNSGEGFAILL